MGKKILAIVCLIALLFALPGFAVDSWVCPGCGRQVPNVMGSICPYCGARQHAHTWQDATCDSPKTCATCGATEGEALGHDWQDATCTAPRTCARCGKTTGAALGHDWLDATCVSPVTCARCGATAGRAFGHRWQDATCTRAKTCLLCGTTDGEALGHDWQDATCVSPKTCARCGATDGAALGHDWQDATCVSPKACARCGKTTGAALGHRWREATCVSPKTCARCGATDGAALGHDWAAATFVSPKTCRRCGATDGKAARKPKVGDVISFGHYPQTASGNDNTPIEWRVLEVRNDSVVVISEYGLDRRRYHETDSSITWGNCTLRAWLNGDFLNRAFAPEEQARLMTVRVRADANPQYKTKPGSDTRDRVYLLNMDEASRYFASDAERVCRPTPYAKAQGAWTSNTGEGTWWLRTPGSSSHHAAYVSCFGAVYGHGDMVFLDGDVVRPVVVLKLD